MTEVPDRRTQLLDAAARCFAGGGFHATTVAEISLEAGCSPGLLYRYFKGKDDLVTALVEREAERTVAALREAGTAPDVLAGLHAVHDSLTHREHPGSAALHVQIIAEATRGTAVTASVRRHFADVTEALVGTLKVGQDAGVVDRELDVAAAAQVLVALASGHTVLRAVDGEGAPSSEVAAGFVTRMLAPRGGATMTAVTQGAPSLNERARAAALKGMIAGGVAVKRVQGDPIARLVTPSGRRDPYPAYRQARDAGPVVPSMIGWVTARHAIASEVLRDHERFGSAPVPDVERPSTWLSRLMVRLRAGDSNATMRGRRVTADGLFDEVPDPLGDESLIGMDPPDHTRLRRLVGRAFTPRAIAGVRARVEQVAAELLDAAPRRGFEVMEGYAGVLPVVVISELLGIPTSDADKVKRWGDVLASGLDVMGGAPASQVTPALNELGGYLVRHFAERRRTGGDLVIDALIADADSESGLTDRELTATAMLLLAAGFETTVNLIGNGVLALLANPAQRELLTQNSQLAGNLVEEVLRHESSVQLTARMVRRDTEIGGRPVRRGSAVICMLGGANRDPAVFADPDRFDLTRPNARDHLAFAGGVHYCLGASLARLEGEVALGLLFQRYPGLQLDGRVRPGRGLILRGPRRLPLRLA